MKTYTSFRAFYPFYLSQHANLTCRRLHTVGSLGVLALLGWVMLWDVLTGKLPR